MNILKPAIFFLLLVLSYTSTAQQATLWALNNNDPYLYNPAYGGFDRSLSANFHLINQWNDIEGGVQGQIVNAHLPLYILNGGMGIQFVRDVSGPLTKLGGGVSYNYVLTSQIGLLSLGGRLGIQQWQLNGDVIRTPDGDYSTGINHNDDDLPNVSVSGLASDIDLAVYFQRGAFEIGLSACNILAQNVSFSSTDYHFKTSRYYQFISSYDWDWNESIMLTPHVVLLADDHQVQSQFGVQMNYNRNIMAGVAFRGYSSANWDALIFTAGISISKHFTLFYAYNYTISRLKSVTKNNTHGFTLNYNLNEQIRTGLPPRVIYNPRF